MDYITLLSDVVLPVLHEVLQRCQWVFHYWHHIFRGPGLHGDQYNPCVELFLIDLRTTKCPSVHCFIWCFGLIFCKCHLGQIIPTHTHTCLLTGGEVRRQSLAVGGLISCKPITYRIRRVDHSFGKVLGLAA